MNDTTDTISKQFNQASQHAQDREEGQERPVVSKAHLEELKKSLATPEPRLTMEPGGTAVEQFKTQIEAQKREQIAYMQERLNRLNHKARDDFNMTQMHTDLQKVERER